MSEKGPKGKKEHLRYGNEADVASRGLERLDDGSGKGEKLEREEGELISLEADLLIHVFSYLPS